MKIGLIGFGLRLAYLGRVIHSKFPDARFVGYVDPAPFGLRLFQEDGIDAGQAHESIAALHAAERPDLLMIGSPNHLHLDHVRQSLDTGSRIFCEKPVVTTEAQTYEMLQLLAGRDPTNAVMVGMVLRYAPLYRDLVDARDRGMLGGITSIEASEHIAPYHGAFFMRDWRRSDAWSGGFMLEKCCHDIDLYQNLVGNRPRRVASFGDRKSFVPENDPARRGINDLEVYHRKSSGWQSTENVFDSPGDIIDFQTALVEFEGGENLCFHTNLNVPDEFRRFCVIGSWGMAEGDFVRNFLRVHDAHTGRKLIDRVYEFSSESIHYGADELMIEDIFAHLTDGRPLPVSVIDGLAAGLTAIKIDEARRTGQVVDMSDAWQRFDEALSAVPGGSD